MLTKFATQRTNFDTLITPLITVFVLAAFGLYLYKAIDQFEK